MEISSEQAVPIKLVIRIHFTLPQRKTPQLKTPLIIPITELLQEPYAAILCYPKPNQTELQSRLIELQNLGVDAVEFSGKTNAYGVPAPILGKGYVGVVVVAHVKGQRVAMKILRADADRPDLLHEAKMLRKAEAVDVAPKLFGASKNILLMQLIEGDLLPKWLEKHNDKNMVHQVLTSVLESCYQLDTIGLDHGELSKAPKHVIVDRNLKTWIVDFETASDKRKPANLPAICHFLFNSSGEVARTVALILGDRDKEKIISALHDYKRCRSSEAFERIIQVCLS